ncbi:hypothetical protein B0H14DRAFT_3491051 [Mycena olivaceomarginata]|nr:hypothetical protein B0H14DRAFT_3491051 [Mycena olivaceomarginata]
MPDVNTSFLFPSSSPSSVLSSWCIPPPLPYLWLQILIDLVARTLLAFLLTVLRRHFLHPPHPHLDSPQIPSHTLNAGSPIRPHLGSHVMSFTSSPLFDYLTFDERLRQHPHAYAVRLPN